MKKQKSQQSKQDMLMHNAEHPFYKILGGKPSNRKAGQTFITFTNKPKPTTKAPKNKEILQEFSLPLSQTTFDKLQKTLDTGQIEWKDLSTELIQAYNRFDKLEREAKWAKMVRTGEAGYYE